MRREDLTLTYVSVSLSYPTLPQFPAHALTNFHSAIHDAHPFSSFRERQDSAYMDNEGLNSLLISRDGLTYDEEVRVDIDLIRRKVVDLVRLAQQHFRIRTFIIPELKLRRLWPAPDEAQPVWETLRNRAFSLSEDQYRYLGEIDGGSMTFAGVRETPHMHWSVEIAPYLADNSQVYLELTAAFLEAMQTPEVVGESIDIADRFMTENVARFVETVMP